MYFEKYKKANCPAVAINLPRRHLFNLHQIAATKIILRGFLTGGYTYKILQSKKFNIILFSLVLVHICLSESAEV